jgi:hypothetical protein
MATLWKCRNRSAMVVHKYKQQEYNHFLQHRRQDSNERDIDDATAELNRPGIGQVDFNISLHYIDRAIDRIYSMEPVIVRVNTLLKEHLIRLITGSATYNPIDGWMSLDTVRNKRIIKLIKASADYNNGYWTDSRRKMQSNKIARI